MVRFAYFVLALAAVMSAFSLIPTRDASGAIEPEARQQVAEIGAAAVVNGAADVEMRFIQEDGPESGHVRVLLTPQTRALTFWEARLVAQQGFLEALNEEALGEGLRRITVVVRLMPGAHQRPPAAEQVFRFLHKGGKDWSILVGE